MSDVQESAAIHQNGVEKVAPNLAEPMASPPAPASVKGVNMDTLRERHKDMTQGVNSLRAEKEQLEKRLVEVNEGILRTEGALVMLAQIVNEADPGGPQGTAGGGQAR